MNNINSLTFIEHYELPYTYVFKHLYSYYTFITNYMVSFKEKIIIFRIFWKIAILYCLNQLLNVHKI